MTETELHECLELLLNLFPETRPDGEAPFTQQELDLFGKKIKSRNPDDVKNAIEELRATRRYRRPQVSDLLKLISESSRQRRSNRDEPGHENTWADHCMRMARRDGCPSDTCSTPWKAVEYYHRQWAIRERNGLFEQFFLVDNWCKVQRQKVMSNLRAAGLESKGEAEAIALQIYPVPEKMLLEVQ